MAKCAKCQKDVSDCKDVIKCGKCSSAYHAACCRIRTVAKLSAMSTKQVNEWRCDVCSEDFQSDSNRSDGENNSIIVMLKSITTEMRENRAANQASFAELKSTMSSVQATLEDMRRRVLQVEEDNRAIKNECGKLRTENVELAKRVNNLEFEIMDMQQYSRNQNIEISGVPVTPGEDVYNIMESVAKALKVRYDRRDVSTAHRMPVPAAANDTRRPRQRHPGIVAQFISRSTRAVWLAAARENKIKTTNLAPFLPEGPVFIGDHLTKHNKILLGRARFHVRQQNLAFAWARDGKVFIKKTVDSRALRVRFIEDVEREVDLS